MRVLLDVIGATIINFVGLALAIYTDRPRLWAGVTVLLVCAMVYFSLQFQ